MSLKNISLNSGKLIYSIVIPFYLGIYFSGFIPIYYIVLFILLFTKHRIDAVFSCLGLALSLLFLLSNYWKDESAYLGLDTEKTSEIRMTLSEDSFLSSKGKRIYKGKISHSFSQLEWETSSKGEVLVIDQRNSPPCSWGEILRIPVKIDYFFNSESIDFIAFADGEIIKEAYKSRFFQFRNNVMVKAYEKCQFFDDDVASLFIALFMGNSDYLEIDFKEKFKKSGISHLLALSGFHVAILVLLFTFLLKKIIGKKTSILISFPLLFAYLLFTGFSPSILRAVIMYVLGGFFILNDQKIPPLLLLLTSSFFQLMIDPRQMDNLGFQLSYMALGGILFLGKAINYRLLPWVPHFIRYPLSASLGAQIFTAPILFYQFSVLYPIGVISSLIMTPLITVFMWISLFTFIFSNALLRLSQDRVINYLLSKIHKLTLEFSSLFANNSKVNFSMNSTLFVYLSIILIIVLFLYIDIWRIDGRRKCHRLKLRFSNRD